MEKNTFLFETASDLFNKFGKDNKLHKITVLTPSKRSKIFMNKYFSKLSDGKAVWSPKYKSTIDLFSEISDLNLYENQIQKISVLWTLWEVYREKVRNESFDEFFAFGEILLNDFDEIDKEMIDAKVIFKNIAELSEISKPNYLTEEQIEIIKRFFNFKYEKTSQLQKRFFEIWNKLYEVYVEFKSKIESENTAYEGMIMRKIAQNLQSVDYSKKFMQEKYVFVGYNKFSKAELELVKYLDKQDKTLFYWDTDKYYFDNKACRNMKTYMESFCGETDKIPDNFEKSDKNISFVKCVNGVSQTGFITKWLKNIENFDDADSAIVLCDENLLPAVLSFLPKEINSNIEISYSLRQTQIANLLLLFMDLQIKGVRKNGFDFDYLQPILQNYYMQKVYKESLDDKTHIQKSKRFLIKPNTELLFENGEKHFVLTDGSIFKAVKNPKELLRFLQDLTNKIINREAFESRLEAAAVLEISKMLQKMERISEIVENCETFVKIIKKLLFSMKIADYGKPAEGLQVIAMSYTVNMDFENLLILSANDEIIPKIKTENSFIPQFLRKIFDMDTAEKQNLQEYYNFYRLLQRAKNISISYFTGKSGISKGEMSRYLLQLLWESPYKDNIKEISLNGEIENLQENQLFEKVEKNAEILSKLKAKYGGKEKFLSPSAFNNYIDCPLLFYFKYVAEIKKPDSCLELDSAVLGKIFHKTMEYIYSKKGKISVDFFDEYLQNNEITPKTKDHISKAFDSEYFGTQTPVNEYNGEQLIFFKVISRMAKNILSYDKSYAPFEILGLEEEHGFEIEINGAKISTAGIIDRIDKKDSIVRIVDYKTGRIADAKNDYCRNLEELFDENRKNKSGYLFQTFLYSSILCEKKEFDGNKIQPALIFTLQADSENYSPNLKLGENEIQDFREYKKEFEENFCKKLDELFDVTAAFKKRDKDDYCQFCDYCEICGKTAR